MCAQVPPQRPAGCRALLPTGAGPLLTGGSDGGVRLWDAARPDASYMVCGPPQLPPEAPNLAAASGGGNGRAPVPVSYVYSQRSLAGVGVLEESCIARGTEGQARMLVFCITRALPLACKARAVAACLLSS
jgi:hypothetical protein